MTASRQAEEVEEMTPVVVLLLPLRPPEEGDVRHSSGHRGLSPDCLSGDLTRVVL